MRWQRKGAESFFRRWGLILGSILSWADWLWTNWMRFTAFTPMVAGYPRPNAPLTALSDIKSHGFSIVFWRYIRVRRDVSKTESFLSYREMKFSIPIMF